MSNIKVILTTALIDLTNGEKEITVDASSVKEALEKLVTIYGDDFKNKIFESENKLRRFINLYVNGKDIRFLDGLETSIGVGDEITLLPAVSGGSPFNFSEKLNAQDKSQYY